MFPTIPVRPAAVCQNDPQTVKLWEAMPGNHRGETVIVSSATMSDLRTAQSVIDAVKENLSYGAGNLKNDFMLSAGESYYRSIAARHVRNTDFRGDNNGLAKSALSAQAGACSEYSALAMVYLSNMGLERPVFTYTAANEPDHQFNIIGDIREPRAAVVVDPWPTFAKAHLVNNAGILPLPNSVLDVHYPGMSPRMKIEDIGDVQALDSHRVARINQLHNTPSYQEVISQRPEIGLRNKLHGIRNLGVRYQNQDQPNDVVENTVDRDHYERQAHGVRLARQQLES